MGEIVALALAGILLGSGAHWLKEDAQKAQSVIDELDDSAYETCLDFNQTAELLGDETEKLDCEENYLK